MSEKVPQNRLFGRFGNFLRRHPWLAATIGATAIGTAIATGGANAETNPAANHAVASMPAQVGDATVTASVGTSDTVPGDGELSLPSVSLGVGISEAASRVVDDDYVEEKRVVEESVTDIFTANAMEYAKRFHLDSNAKVASSEVGIDGAIDTIEQRLADGWTLEGVKVHGTASDEDDTLSADGVTQSSDAGLDVPAPTSLGDPRNHNELLADVRGEAGSKLLQEKVLASLGIDISQITKVLPGEEIINHELNNQIRTLAKNYQVTPLELLDAYNGIGTTQESLDLKARLDKDDGAMAILNVLKEHRTAIVEMRFVQTVTEPVIVNRGGNIVQEERVVNKVHIEIVPIIVPLFLLAALARKGIKVMPFKNPPTPVGPPLPPMYVVPPGLVRPSDVLPKPEETPPKIVPPKPKYPTPDRYKRKDYLKGGPTRPGFEQQVFRIRDPGTASQGNRGPVTTHRGNRQSTGRTPKRSMPKGRQKRR